MSREDHIALRQARLMGVALSADDLDGDQPHPIQGEDGEMNMERVLADLLACLGVHLPANLDEPEFKRQLATECLKKVGELTRTGQAQGKSGANDNKQANPLIPGGGGVGRVEPIYMSLAIENLRLENETLKM